MFRALYKKELLSASRNLKMPAFIIANNVILAFVTIFAYYLEVASRPKWEQTASGVQVLNIFCMLFLIEYGLGIVLILALSIPSVYSDRRNHSFDLILMSGESALKYILAKLASRVTICILIIFSSAPIFGFVFYIGGVSLQDFGFLLMVLLVTIIYIASIGIFFSSHCRKRAAATISTYTVVLLILVGTLITFGGIYLMKKVNMGVEIDDTNRLITIGNLMYILVINPLYGILRFFHEHFGTMSQIRKYLFVYHKSLIIREQWVLVSSLIQLAISTVLIFISARKLRIGKRNTKRAILN